MKLATTFAVLSTVLSSINANTQSGPFKLKIASTLAGKPDQYVVPYRKGAMNFKLSLNNGDGTVWRLNYTSGSTTQGYLTTSINYSQRIIPFGITVEPRLGSNTAELGMAPRDMKDQSGLTEFAIDQQQHLTINGGLDDTNMPIFPPKWLGGLSRWAACKGLGYPIGEIDTLVWVLGNQKPQNPACMAADLRVVPVPAR
jgi:hypothetical protein